MKKIKPLTEVELAEYPHLPNGWKWARLGEIAGNIQYGYTQSSTNEAIGPKFLRITDIQDSKVMWESVPYCEIDDIEKQKYILKSGDLVFARTGATVGKSYLLKGEFPESVFASYLIRVSLFNKISNQYIYNFFQSLVYWKQITEGQVGIGQPNVNGTKLSSLIVPIAPVAEQHAIVSKIEQLSSDLDNGISNLKLAREQLKVYRQAVLKKAFEGDLTREWRQQQTNLPAAEDLLEQIRMEREESYNKKLEEWKRAVKDWEAAGKEGKKPSKPKKPKGNEHLTEIELEKLPKLQDEWAWVKVQFIGEVVAGGTPKTKIVDYWNDEISWITPADLSGYTQKYISKGRKSISKKGLSNSSAKLMPKGSVLFSSRAPIGYVVIAESELSTNQGFKNIVPVGSIKSEYIYYYFKSIKQIAEERASGTTFKEISATVFSELPFPLCSLPEQQAIVTEIETRLSVCDKVEQDIEENLEKAEALRQSILKKAFEGKLLNEREMEEVHNSPDWEPAEVLLGRIKTEKTNKK